MNFKIEDALKLIAQNMQLEQDLKLNRRLVDTLKEMMNADRLKNNTEEPCVNNGAVVKSGDKAPGEPFLASTETELHAKKNVKHEEPVITVNNNELEVEHKQQD